MMVQVTKNLSFVHLLHVGHLVELFLYMSTIKNGVFQALMAEGSSFWVCFQKYSV